MRPILAQRFPALDYAAALIGYGSDVLGYDTPRSRDHEWGPRLLLFLPDDTDPRLGEEIEHTLSERLPATFHGYSTSFGPKDAQGVRLLVPGEAGRVTHHVDLWTLAAFTRMELGIAPDEPLRRRDWLVLPDDIKWGETQGITRDSKGNLYVTHTVNAASTSKDAIAVFDRHGQFVRSFGSRFAGGGHGIECRHEKGGEFLYHCDTAHRVVVKTDLNGKLV